MHSRLSAALDALEQGRPHVAWSETRIVLAEDPEDPFALALAAAALRTLGHRSRAEDYRARAASVAAPAFPTADELEFMRRIDELSTDRRASDARSEARRLANEGAYWFHQENLDRAEQCWQAALELDPACAPAHYFRGLLASDVGRESVAALCFVKAIQADPDCASAKLALARLRGRRAPVTAG